MSYEHDRAVYGEITKIYQLPKKNFYTWEKDSGRRQIKVRVPGPIQLTFYKIDTGPNSPNITVCINQLKRHGKSEPLEGDDVCVTMMHPQKKWMARSWRKKPEEEAPEHQVKDLRPLTQEGPEQIKWAKNALRQVLETPDEENDWEGGRGAATLRLELEPLESFLLDPLSEELEELLPDFTLDDLEDTCLLNPLEDPSNDIEQAVKTDNGSLEKFIAMLGASASLDSQPENENGTPVAEYDSNPDILVPPSYRKQHIADKRLRIILARTFWAIFFIGLCGWLYSFKGEAILTNAGWSLVVLTSLIGLLAAVFKDK